MNEWKGQYEAIDAIAELVRRGIKARLLIVGDGPKKFTASLHKQVKNLGVESYVSFVGYVKDTVGCRNLADIILVCSHWEAFGRASIEAMLSGKAVIGRKNSGGTEEMLTDGLTGLLYDPERIEDLADKIQFLYESPAKREEIGKAAQHWAKDNFTRKRYAQEIHDLMKMTLTSYQSTHPQRTSLIS